MAARRTKGKAASGIGRTTMDGSPARLRSRLLVFVSVLLACAGPEIREDCRFVHEHVPPPPMPPGFAKLDRVLRGRLMLGTAAVRELSERPRLRTRIKPLQSFYDSRNTVALRRLFAEDLLGRFCARLEVARTRAATGQTREAGVAYQGLLVASQVFQLNVALLQMAVYADEAGQPVVQIQQMALRPLIQLEPLLEASLADDPKRLAAEMPTGTERYNASVAGLDRWAADLKLGTERVKVARILWDTLLASAAAVEMAAVMAEAAVASSGPPAAMAAFTGTGGAAQLALNRAVVLEVAAALQKLIAAGALDHMVVAGLHAMASGASVPLNVSRLDPVEQLAEEGTGDGPKLSGLLQDAAKGKGDFGVGSATREQAEAAGRAWVGPQARIASDGKTLVCRDGLRVYRPPSYKPSLGKMQANFEQKLSPGGQPYSNAHLDIIEP